MAAELGFEPRMNESESLVLPLHHSAIFAVGSAFAQPTNSILANPGAKVKTLLGVFSEFSEGRSA